ncbi:MAG TPA: SdpI family protein [Opitutaceae bacterium]|jgi:hypothetical protein|nr:SdpI family protein [Opitutaceae bacterium]
MNPVALTHFIAGLVMIAVSLPLIKRKVKMNPWYGIRIPAAFESEQRWLEINEYGGRLLLRCGVLIAIVASPEFFLREAYLAAYALAASALIVLALGLTIGNIFRHARRTKS